MSAEPEDKGRLSLTEATESTMTRIPRDTEERIRTFRRVLAQLSRSDAAERGDLDTALAHLTEVAAETMRVERASVWRYSDDRSKLVCVDLYERLTDRHMSGTVIDASDKPRYFEALSEERSIAAHDAWADERTSEFTDSYLRPLGISSMMDAPIVFQGNLVGVVCIEHVGKARKWLAWEELVAGSFADFVAMVLGAAQNSAQAAEISQARRDLQRKAGPLAGRESPRAFFDFLPSALVVLNPRDGSLESLNRHAKALLGHFAAGLTAKEIGNIFVNDADKQRLLGKIGAGVAVDRFEAVLRRGEGAPVRCVVNAQLMDFIGEPSLVLGLHPAAGDG
jgi:GAF domain-containing protein